ncbi:MAG: hypothetical protein IJW25_00080 [Clostridia bacterium]|nr:hypothetical protein [Clostridia bacterium]
MKFIECHEKETGIKVLIPLSRIITISQSHEDLTAFIETAIDVDGNGVGFYTKELYAEIVIQLRKIA